ncbi:MAG: hypothetical protein HWE25_12520 [Alphaproteobacteria bacterium]|nr:hypothetical protein [Alphaproteobacteria bacterium]
MKGFFAWLLLGVFTCWPAQASGYPWLETAPETDTTLIARYPAPRGFRRMPVAPESFAEFLRYLPVKPEHSPLRYFDGKKVVWSQYAGAIIDLDVGGRDLQQCADTLIRLYSEYRFSIGQTDALTFNFTSGDAFPYTDYLKGRRPVVEGRKVSWRVSEVQEHGREAFLGWMNIVFQYAGTASLARDLPEVKLKAARIGDLFIAPGFPGHTVMIADMALDTSGKRKVLLVEGFSPAQDAHVLRNLLPFSSGDWYDLEDGKDLITPVWRFTPNQLHRMK